LERIFIESRLYKQIETIKTLEAIYETLQEAFFPFRKQLIREPNQDDLERLLQIPIRRISRFDIDKNKEEIANLEKAHRDVEKHLKNVRKYTIDYLKKLIVKYQDDHPRKTRLKSIEEIDRRAIETKELKIGYDLETGFVGTKVSGANHLSCTNFDKLFAFSKNGTYKVVNIPEKQYFEGLVCIGIADKKTVVNVVYRKKDTGHIWAKRFIVDQFIMDKAYHYLDEDVQLEHISLFPDVIIETQTPSHGKKKAEKLIFSLKDVPVKGAQTRGVRLVNQKVKKILFRES